MNSIILSIKPIIFKIRVGLYIIVKRILNAVNPYCLKLYSRGLGQIKLLNSWMSYPNKRETPIDFQFYSGINTNTLKQGQQHRTKNIILVNNDKVVIQEVIIENIGEKVKMTVPKTFKNNHFIYIKPWFEILFMSQKNFIMERHEYNPTILERYYNTFSPEKSALTYSIELDHSDIKTALEKLLDFELQILTQLDSLIWDGLNMFDTTYSLEEKNKTIKYFSNDKNNVNAH